ncbi:MAG: alpha/beta hydrolase [Phycisphaerales bacterium]
MDLNGSEKAAVKVDAKKAMPTRRRLLRLGVLIALGYVAWCFALFFKQGDLIFPREYANRPLKKVPGGVDVWTRDVDGVKVEAWFLVGADRTAESPGPAVMLFHGNAELIDNWMPIAEEYAKRGFSVLLPEYRGYGRCGGSPSQSAIAEDMRYWRAKLNGTEIVKKDKVVYHGRSLGGGIAAQLAKDAEPAALILDCTFTSIASYASGYGVPGFVVTSPFRTDEVIPALSCPVLISHGRDDGTVPFSHGKALAALAKRGTFVELPGGHLDFPGDEKVYDAARWEFLEEVTE